MPEKEKEVINYTETCGEIEKERKKNLAHLETKYFQNTIMGYSLTYN